MAKAKLFVTLCMYDDTGRRPFKLLPTDAEFSKDLIETTQDSFTRTLPKCVKEDLNSAQDSRVLNLWTGSVTSYAGYLRRIKARHEGMHTCTILTFCFEFSVRHLFFNFEQNFLVEHIIFPFLLERREHKLFP